jgi:uncharacterized membrane protein YcaP (DUF421 family)
MDELTRLLLGKDPFAFLAEVAVRTIVIYLVLMVIVRLLGKRMSGQLSNLELAVMMTLGAVVSPPMQISERGLLPAVLQLAALLCCQRVIATLTAKYGRFERTVFARGSTLVEDGRLLLPAMKDACICHEQLFGQLRTHGIRHLGQVRRVYLEVSGTFSILRAPEPRPGLAIVPAVDTAMARDLPEASVSACDYCGHVEPRATDRPCKYCGACAWKRAVAVNHEEMQRTPAASEAQAHAS